MEPSCCMCGGICTLRHILTGCPTALHQGRYTWRHNSILTVLQSALTQAWSNQAKHSTTTHNLPYITFVKPGAKLPTSRQPLLSSSLLTGISDWTFLFDLGEGLAFPPEIAITNLRPDAVIFSRHLRTVIMLELTVPIEDRVSISENIKTAWYKNLISECHSNGWKTHLITIEIGCRGYVPNNLIPKLKQLGLSKASCSDTRKVCSTTALRCSYVLYLNRNNTS